MTGKPGKPELRARARSIRGADRNAATREIAKRLAELPELARAPTIAVYAAIGDEVPLEGFAAGARERGARTVYPIRAGVELELAAVESADALRAGAQGLLEPARDAPRVAVEEVDAFLVPGLMFDRACRRLGRGGGHYDRLLARKRRDATAIGICYADRVIEALPEDPWDVAMDCVVTEQLVVRRPPSGSAS